MLIFVICNKFAPASFVLLRLLSPSHRQKVFRRICVHFGTANFNCLRLYATEFGKVKFDYSSLNLAFEFVSIALHFIILP